MSILDLFVCLVLIVFIVAGGFILSGSVDFSIPEKAEILCASAGMEVYKNKDFTCVKHDGNELSFKKFFYYKGEVFFEND